MVNYDSAFFDYVNSGAIRSALELLPLLQEQIHAKKVLDVGCGQGGWLSVWKKLGCDTVHGVDGDYVERQRLFVEESEFTAADLSNPFDLNTCFDLAQSLEVGEHLPASSAEGFIACIVKHAPIVLFSAAPRGQGGDNHINEQDYEFWRQHFQKHGYIAIDYIRPLIQTNEKIEPWYRYNTFLYVDENQVANLSPVLKQCIVPKDQALADNSPFLYKLRKAVISMLPVSVATRAAKIKEIITTKQRASV